MEAPIYDLTSEDLTREDSKEHYTRLVASKPKEVVITEYWTDDDRLLVSGKLITDTGDYLFDGLTILLLDYPTEEAVGHLVYGRMTELVHESLYEQLEADAEADEDDEDDEEDIEDEEDEDEEQPSRGRSANKRID